VIYALYFIHVIVCIFLILVVLLQQGKGADLSVFGGGTTQTAFGARGDTTLLHKLTVASFVIFILTTLAIGLPKLYEPSVADADGGSFVFRARLSETLAWTVTVTDGGGAQVAAGGGESVLVEWTWDAAKAPAGRYRYTIAAAGARAATGTILIGDAPAPPEPPQPPPPPARPSGIPRRIPRWAWDLRRWQLTPKAQRGPRPESAPRRLPSWYWLWFSWQQALDRWKEQYG